MVDVLLTVTRTRSSPRGHASVLSELLLFWCATLASKLQVYPVGIPLLYFYILWSNRRSLNPRVRMEQENPSELEQPLSATKLQQIAVAYLTNISGSGANKSQQPTTAVPAELARELEILVTKRKQDPALVPSMFLWKDFGENIRSRC